MRSGPRPLQLPKKTNGNGNICSKQGEPHPTAWAWQPCAGSAPRPRRKNSPSNARVLDDLADTAIDRRGL
eukprot:8875671-Lingulodinium_polyedra.AAC.1